MAIIDTDKLITIAGLAEEMATTPAVARTIIGETQPTLKIGNTKMYDREEIKAALYERHKTLLDFLGVLPPAQSYDPVVVTE